MIFFDEAKIQCHVLGLPEDNGREIKEATVLLLIDVVKVQMLAFVPEVALADHDTEHTIPKLSRDRPFQQFFGHAVYCKCLFNAGS